jgi:prepilin-type N-terminal cleavage/methylation domain-containing protein
MPSPSTRPGRRLTRLRLRPFSVRPRAWRKASAAGFTLVEALVAVALLAIALVPILSTADRLLAASRRAGRRAALHDAAEAHLADAIARLDRRSPGDVAAPTDASAALPDGWRESGVVPGGALWTLHARPVDVAPGGIQRWRIEVDVRGPEGRCSVCRERLVAPREPPPPPASD